MTSVICQCGVRPCGWTGSSRGFDRARSVLILELHRRQEVPERGLLAVPQSQAEDGKRVSLIPISE